MHPVEPFSTLFLKTPFKRDVLCALSRTCTYEKGTDMCLESVGGVIRSNCRVLLRQVGRDLPALRAYGEEKSRAARGSTALCMLAISVRLPRFTARNCRLAFSSHTAVTSQSDCLSRASVQSILRAFYATDDASVFQKVRSHMSIRTWNVSMSSSCKQPSRARRTESKKL